MSNAGFKPQIGCLVKITSKFSHNKNEIVIVPKIAELTAYDPKNRHYECRFSSPDHDVNNFKNVLGVVIDNFPAEFSHHLFKTHHFSSSIVLIKNKKYVVADIMLQPMETTRQITPPRVSTLNRPIT